MAGTAQSTLFRSKWCISAPTKLVKTSLCFSFETLRHFVSRHKMPQNPKKSGKPESPENRKARKTLTARSFYCFRRTCRRTVRRPILCHDTKARPPSAVRRPPSAVPAAVPSAVLFCVMTQKRVRRPPSAVRRPPYLPPYRPPSYFVS